MNDDDAALLEPIAKAIGLLVIEWNDMCESFGTLFADIMHPQEAISPRALAVWNAIGSDKVQRDMLRSSAKAWGQIPEAAKVAPSLSDDVEWLCGRADALSDHRNNLVHAPFTFKRSNDMKAQSIVPSTFTGHKRASRLEGRDLGAEIERATETARALKLFSRNVSAAVQFGAAVHPWPARPQLPILRA